MTRRSLLLALSVLAVAACGGESQSRASDVPVATVTTTVVPGTTETTAPVETTAATTPTTAPAPETTTAPAATVVVATVVVATVAPVTVPATVAPTTAAPTTPTTAAPPPATTAPCRVATYDDIVRRGDCGEVVKFIQERLTVLGFPAAADGLFGPGTESAVKSFQSARGLVADGLVGPLTWEALVEGGIGD